MHLLDVERNVYKILLAASIIEPRTENCRTPSIALMIPMTASAVDSRLA